jgi:hypothetical protein
MPDRLLERLGLNQPFLIAENLESVAIVVRLRIEPNHPLPFDQIAQARLWARLRSDGVEPFVESRVTATLGLGRVWEDLQALVLQQMVGSDLGDIGHDRVVERPMLAHVQPQHLQHLRAQLVDVGVRERESHVQHDMRGK